MINIEELEKWIVEHDAIRITEENFIQVLDNYEKEHPENYIKHFNEIDKNKLNYEIVKKALNLLTRYEDDLITISISMNVYYGDKQIANYEVWFSLAGEIVDDFLE